MKASELSCASRSFAQQIPAHGVLGQALTAAMCAYNIFVEILPSLVDDDFVYEFAD